MKAIDPGLQAHLDGGATTMALCWKLTRADGAVLGFTEHDLDLGFDGVTYAAATGFSASQIEQSLGLAVDNLNAAGALSSAAINEDDLARGVYDGAGVDIFAVNWRDASERVLLLAGSIGEVRRGKTAFEAEIRSQAHVLGQATGRTYQYYCDAELGDARCAVDLGDPAYTGSGTVTTVSGTGFAASGLGAYAGGWFAGGKLTWTGGSNGGLAFEVKSHDGTAITLWAAPPEPIQPGDTFDVSAGCDKSQKTCIAKFGNIVNFRGFPHMPGNDVVQSYPNRGEARLDGASLFS
jgi:uncharacterized phage protein (TIGR02218 family)